MTFMEKGIGRIINDTEYLPGKIFALTIQGLIILSIVSFSLETLPGISQFSKACLNAIEIITVIIFSFEYVLRIIAARKKTDYVISFYGLIDLAAILPFYLASGLDLRAIRIFRMIRLIRVMKLFKYSRAIKRFHRALVIVREELILFSIVAAMMLYLSAVGIYYFENQAQPDQYASVFHSLWWSVTTLTTVGYGDMYPVTVGGKCFTFFVLMVGLGVVAVPTGLVASALTQARDEESILHSRQSPRTN